MTSDDKTLAFLARRVGALERKLDQDNASLEDKISAVSGTQQQFAPIVHAIFEGITKNGDDHEKIMKHLGIK